MAVLTVLDMSNRTVLNKKIGLCPMGCAKVSKTVVFSGFKTSGQELTLFDKTPTYWARKPPLLTVPNPLFRYQTLQYSGSNPSFRLKPVISAKTRVLPVIDLSAPRVALARGLNAGPVVHQRVGSGYHRAGLAVFSGVLAESGKPGTCLI